MTDEALAQALSSAKALEGAAREWYTVTTRSRDEAERDASLVVVRHVTATRKALETWIGARAVRAQMGRR